MSWTTEPREDSSTEMITFMRGSMRAVPGVGDVPGADWGEEGGGRRVRKAAVVECRAAEERAEAVVSVP